MTTYPFQTSTFLWTIIILIGIPSLYAAPGEKTSSKQTMTCPDDYTGLMPYNNCEGFYNCVNGNVASPFRPCGTGTEFDYSIQTCNWPYAFTCADTTASSPTLLPTPSPSSAPSTAEPTATNFSVGAKCCPSGHTGPRPYDFCSKYYNCVDGDVDYSTTYDCPSGTLFNKDTNICEKESQVTCVVDSCVTVAPSISQTPSLNPSVTPSATPSAVPSLVPTENPSMMDRSLFCQFIALFNQFLDLVSNFLSQINSVIDGGENSSISPSSIPSLRSRSPSSTPTVTSAPSTAFGPSSTPSLSSAP